ncbi:MAG: hypothetical protein J6331_06170, partial [Lentisphaeria bacterium]|nr:hypothetical protein [Lentisphaeria bacterium]
NDFLACIASFQQDSDRPYIYDAAKFHTLELENKPFSLKKGEKKDYAFSFHFVRGLSGVDAWEDLTALQILLPAGADQKNLASFEVKAGTAFLTMQEVTLEATILGENGEKLLSFAPQTGETLYEKPFTGRFQGAFGKLPDGACTVRIRASRKNGKTFTAEKKIVFVGEKLSLLRKKAERLAEMIEARKDRTSRATYEKRILLESLRRSIALADTAKAAEEIRALEEK